MLRTQPLCFEGCRRCRLNPILVVCCGNVGLGQRFDGLPVEQIKLTPKRLGHVPDGQFSSCGILQTCPHQLLQSTGENFRAKWIALWRDMTQSQCRTHEGIKISQRAFSGGQQILQQTLGFDFLLQIRVVDQTKRGKPAGYNLCICPSAQCESYRYGLCKFNQQFIRVTLCPDGFVRLQVAPAFSQRIALGKFEALRFKRLQLGNGMVNTALKGRACCTGSRLITN